MAKRRNLSLPFLFSIVFVILSLWYAAAIQGSKDVAGAGAAILITKEQRRTLVSTDSGGISAVEIGDVTRRPYQLQFITLDPNSLFLPVLLHADMVFYVHTGCGSLGWVGDDVRDEIQVKRGDVYRLQAGSVFFVRSSLELTRERLRIYAIFSTDDSDQNPYEPYIGAYSKIRDLVLGFDEKLLQSAFQVPEEVIEEILSERKPPEIVHITSRNETEQTEGRDWRAGIIEALIGPEVEDPNGKKKKKKSSRIFNLFTAKPDFENCNGWSLEVDTKDLQALKGSNVGVFMVNLTKGSMMSPHWNPRGTEIAVVIHGQGMVRVVCPSNNGGSGKEPECKNMRFRVSEGDVFVVSRFHPMAQMSFNNNSLVFMGFSTMAASNYPQFLTGMSSVLRTLDRDILALAFNVPVETIDRWLDSQNDSIILDCTSCAEEEEAAMEEEIEKERQEKEERKRKEEEEEAREREEEARKRQEEEEARRREEEQERRREEEEERKRKEEEEEAREREEEARERQEEEEARRREEEKERRREEEEEEAREREEEARKRQEEEEEARKREEEIRRRQEEEEARRREEEEEEEEAKREEEKARRREEEEEGRRREEEEEEEAEEAEERQQEKERRRREEEEEEEEEELEEEEAEARQREKERRRREEEEEEARRREEEEEEEEEARRREEEEEEEEEARRRWEEEEEARRATQQRQNRWSEEKEGRWLQEMETRERVEWEGGGGGQATVARRVLRSMWRI